MDQRTDATVSTKATSESLHKNKTIIKGITLILTEIIEDNSKEEKKKEKLLKLEKNLSSKETRTSLKENGILFIIKR